MNRHETFSQWFDNQLQQAGISGKELATRVGVSEATISRVRNGRIPLSPKMKNRLSSVLNARMGDIPTVVRKTISPNQKLWMAQHAIPDHAASNYAVSQGLFLAQGISVEEISDRDIGSSYPGAYYAAIKEQLAKGRAVLAVGPESEFRQHNLVPAGSLLSHTYRGYHLIARGNTTVPSVDDAPMHQRIFALKMFLEQLENADIWARDFERFSWRSSIDLEFLIALRELAAEFTGVCAPEDIVRPTRFSNKSGLDSLHAFGHQGADFVLADAGTLSEAYSHPEQYKVLLSLEKLRKIIETMSVDAPPVLLASLKRTYLASNVADALSRFKTRWLDRLSQLEVPVYWHVFCGANVDAANKQQMINAVANVLSDVQQELGTVHLREKAISEIKKYCDARAYQPQGNPNLESFQLAWQNCYGGL